MLSPYRHYHSTLGLDQRVACKDYKNCMFGVPAEGEARPPVRRPIYNGDLLLCLRVH